MNDMQNQYYTIDINHFRYLYPINGKYDCIGGEIAMLEQHAPSARIGPHYFGVKVALGQHAGCFDVYLDARLVHQCELRCIERTGGGIESNRHTASRTN